MQATVYKAFLVSALMFIVMGAIGRVVKRPVWNGTCLDGSLDRCDHCFCCEHVLEKFWNGLYLEYYLCFLFAGLTAG